MGAVWKAVILAAMAAVASALVLGLFNMAFGNNPNRNQWLMRWRVALQLVAILAIMTAIYLTSH
jgi:multisubunit Na+/H+ antiporter MnhB subunit